jgi:hypothetical protein
MAKKCARTFSIVVEKGKKSILEVRHLLPDALPRSVRAPPLVEYDVSTSSVVRCSTSSRPHTGQLVQRLVQWFHMFATRSSQARSS